MATPCHAALQVTSLSVNTVLHFGSGVYKMFRSLKAQKKTSSTLKLSENSNQLSVLSSGFNSVAQTMEEFEGIDSDEFDDDANVIPAVVGMALCYPNPFRQLDGTQLGYRLSKNFDVEIHIYDMLANQIFKKVLPKGSIGAQKGYNKIRINIDTFDSYSLSAGVYFYLLIHDGEVLTKGKMAIIP